MTVRKWLLRSVVDAVHDMQLAEHGGVAGTRDATLLESALANPLNMDSYGAADLCSLAAAYAFGIVRNHPYVDGNKRITFLAVYIFLNINGLELTADEVAATAAVLRLAAGEIGEIEFADWLRSNTNRLD